MPLLSWLLAPGRAAGLAVGAIGVLRDTRTAPDRGSIELTGASSGRVRRPLRQPDGVADGDQPLTVASTSSPYNSSLRAPMPGSPESSRRFAGRVSAIACSV